MAQPWSAEWEVPNALARILVEEQFPELKPLRVELFGEGWDNRAYLVKERTFSAFRGGKFAVPLLEAKPHILPAIAARLPLAVPRPAFVGQPTGHVRARRPGAVRT